MSLCQGFLSKAIETIRILSEGLDIDEVAQDFKAELVNTILLMHSDKSTRFAGALF